MSRPIRYIIAIRPPADIVAEVKGMKLTLKREPLADSTIASIQKRTSRSLNFMQFWCNSLAIRKFNDDGKQFDVIAELPMMERTSSLS